MMKKKVLMVATVLCVVLGVSGCNKQVFDTNYKFDRAIISLPNGQCLEVDVDKWKDYDGEQIQITAKDGTVYLTSSFNCTLIKVSNRE